jgi:hypothetical protein
MDTNMKKQKKKHKVFITDKLDFTFGLLDKFCPGNKKYCELPTA